MYHQCTGPFLRHCQRNAFSALRRTRAARGAAKSTKEPPVLRAFLTIVLRTCSQHFCIQVCFLIMRKLVGRHLYKPAPLFPIGHAYLSCFLLFDFDCLFFRCLILLQGIFHHLLSQNIFHQMLSRDIFHHMLSQHIKTECHPAAANGSFLPVSAFHRGTGHQHLGGNLIAAFVEGSSFFHCFCKSKGSPCPGHMRIPAGRDRRKGSVILS